MLHLNYVYMICLKKVQWLLLGLFIQCQRENFSLAKYDEKVGLKRTNTSTSLIKFGVTNLRPDLDIFVISLPNATNRLSLISGHLDLLGLKFDVVRGYVPEDLNTPKISNITPTTDAVWHSHRACAKLVADNYNPALILEDDAGLRVNKDGLLKMLEDMEEYDLDLIQVGFLTLNIFDGISILARNLYSFFIRNTIFANFFWIFGLKEVQRSKRQFWRKKIPPQYVVNDIRYGGQAYFISPRFASVVLELNSPTFLSVDDFFVSLSKMKSFRMVRLKHSKARQIGNLSSFSGRKRFGLDE